MKKFLAMAMALVCTVGTNYVAVYAADVQMK